MNSIYCVSWCHYKSRESGVLSRKHIDLSKIVAIDEVNLDDTFPFFTVTCQLVDEPILFQTARPWDKQLAEEYQNLLAVWIAYQEQE